MFEQITQTLALHIESSMTLADQLTHDIIEAGSQLAERLLSGGKILICAPGRSYANGLHFTNMMLFGSGVERPPLPTLLLSGNLQGISEELQLEHLYTKDMQAFAHSQDILLLLSSPGACLSLIQVLLAAKEKQIPSILLVENEAEWVEEHLNETDTLLCLPGDALPRHLELQLLTLHALCEVIEQMIFNVP